MEEICSNLKKIEENKKEFQQKYEDNNKEFHQKFEDNNKEFQQKFEDNYNIYNNKIKEIQQLRENKENEILNSISKHQEEIKGLQLIQKYVNEKLICEEIEKEKEKERHNYKRVLNITKTNDIFNLEINMILFQEKIKFVIYEIQNNLENNPIIYETNFNKENISEKNVYFKNLEKIENIFSFLHGLFNDSKDSIKKENGKIIVKLKFPLGFKEEEVEFDILKKDISLEKTLNNFSQTLKEINKNNIVAKSQFKKDLLEKVYPIGSYYWSSSNISPSEIFGGTWTKIIGRFLFASDSYHNVDQTGGEERVTLKISEIPFHSHQFTIPALETKFLHVEKGEFQIPYQYNCHKAYGNTLNTKENDRGGYSHNNMPPYLTANCWRRTG